MLNREKNHRRVNTACTLGVRAEQNATFSLVTKDENTIRRILSIRKAIPPCGACRELLSQMMPGSYRNIEILPDYEKGRIVSLDALTPEW